MSASGVSVYSVALVGDRESALTNFDFMDDIRSITDKMANNTSENMMWRKNHKQILIHS